MTLTAGCRLTVVLTFLCGTWNLADPFQLSASGFVAGTTYPTVRHNDPARTTIIRQSTPSTSYTVPPSSVRSTLQTAEKLYSVSSSGKIATDVSLSSDHILIIVADLHVHRPILVHEFLLY